MRFEVTISYDVKDYCKKAGDILIFDVPEIRKSCPVAGKRGLKYPIEVWNTSYKRDEVEFNVPEGYQVYHLPEPMEIKNQYFDFRSSYRQEGKKIFFQGELIMKVLRITPEACASYQQGCLGTEKSFNRSVLFKKKGNRQI